MNCIVCYDNKEPLMDFVCSHQFCHECIKKWFHFNNTCPVCRCVIEPKMFPNTRHNIEKNKKILYTFLRLLLDNYDFVWLKRGIYIYEFLNRNACIFYTNPEIVKVILDQNKEIEGILNIRTKMSKKMIHLLNVSNELCNVYRKNSIVEKK